LLSLKKPHTTAAKLLLPAAIDLASTMIGAAQHLKTKVWLSNDTVRRRIGDMGRKLGIFRSLTDFLLKRPKKIKPIRSCFYSHKKTSEKEKTRRFFGQMSQRKEKLRAEVSHDQLIDQIKHREFGLQLDDTTDGSQEAHMICNVRFVNFTE